MAQISKSCDDVFNQLVQGGVSPDDLYNTVCKQVLFLFFLFLSAYAEKHGRKLSSIFTILLPWIFENCGILSKF